MTSREADSPRNVTRLQNAAAGGVLGAVAASSCCMLPLLLFAVGASGPWIGTLVRLAPYQPYFIAVAVPCLGCGYWLFHRSSTRSRSISLPPCLTHDSANAEKTYHLPGTLR